MNTTYNNIQTVVSYLKAGLALIVTLLISCEEAPKEPLVLKSVEREMVEKAQGFIIRNISNDGTVEVSRPGYRGIVGLPGTPRFKLEGKGAKGDEFELIYHIKDELLENGHVRTTIKGVGVRSKNQKVWDEKFPDATDSGGEKKSASTQNGDYSSYSYGYEDSEYSDYYDYTPTAEGQPPSTQTKPATPK